MTPRECARGDISPPEPKLSTELSTTGGSVWYIRHIPSRASAGPVRHIPQAAAPPTQATYPSDHPHHIPPCQVPLFYATYPHVVRTSRRHIPRLLASGDISQLTRPHPAAKVGGARWGVGRGRSVLRSVWLVLRSTPWEHTISAFSVIIIVLIVVVGGRQWGDGQALPRG